MTLSQMRQKLQKVLDNPKVALVLAFVAIGLTFSPKVCITAARICFLAAFAVAATGLYGIRYIRARASLFVLSLLALGLSLFVLATWIRPDAVPKNFGVLQPKFRLVFAFGTQNIGRTFEIGDSGSMLTYTGPEGTPALKFAENSNLTIEERKGKLYVSTELLDPNGNLIAELKRNQWKVAPSAWDRNYTNDALEIRNPQGRVALQVRLVNDRVQLQGEWWNSSGRGVRLVKSPDPDHPGGLFVFLKTGNEAPQVQPIFEYPSDLHLGELAKHRLRRREQAGPSLPSG